MSEESEYLKVTEVAELLRVRPDTVRGWIARGQLPALRVGPGRQYRVRRADALRALEVVGTCRERERRVRLPTVAGGLDPATERTLERNGLLRYARRP